MTNIDVGYSMMILRFILPNESGKDILWKAVFGDYPNATNPDTRKSRVRVTVTERDITTGDPIAWHIEGLEPLDGIPTGGFSAARIRSKNLKGKTVEQDWGFCQTFIDYDIRLVP